MTDIKSLKSILKQLAEGSSRFKHKGLEYNAKEIKSLVRTFKVYDSVDVEQQDDGKLVFSWKAGKMSFKPIEKLS